MDQKRVVITGIGAITPIGNTVEEYWEGLKNGVSGAGPITLFDASKFKTKFAFAYSFFPLSIKEDYLFLATSMINLS